jgi:cell division protein DivIC
MLKAISRLPPFFRNKYYISLIAFTVWILFFDSNNLFDIYKLRKSYTLLQDEKRFYIEETEKVNLEKEELFSSQKNLEKFARERYFMKRDEEDIYIFESPKKED